MEAAAGGQHSIMVSGNFSAASAYQEAEISGRRGREYRGNFHRRNAGFINNEKSGCYRLITTNKLAARNSKPARMGNIFGNFPPK